MIIVKQLKQMLPSLSKAVTQVEAKTLSLCTSLDNRGNAYVTHEQVKTKIRESYPNAEANGIKLYIKDDYSERYSEYTAK